MTDKHDFKAALEDIPIIKSNPVTPEDFNKAIAWAEKYHDTFLAALRLADRLQSGEVSEDACIAALRELKGKNVTLNTVEGCCKAMSAQLLKEIE